MKYRHMMDEIENSIEDEAERSRVMDGLLGYILSTTQVGDLIYVFWVLLHDTIGVKKKSHHNFIRILIFVIYYKGGKKVTSVYYVI